MQKITSNKMGISDNDILERSLDITWQSSHYLESRDGSSCLQPSQVDLNRSNKFPLHHVQIKEQKKRSSALETNHLRETHTTGMIFTLKQMANVL